MRLPNVIIKTFDNRIQEALLASGIDSVSSDLFANLPLGDNNIKDRVELVLRRIYKKEGYNVFMQTIMHLKKFNNRDKDDVIIAKGEIAEVVSSIMIEHYVKVNNLRDWRLYRGLILGSKKDPNFSTELDLVLVTPKCASIIEVKSYNGPKTLKGECTLVVKGNTKDVYSQNIGHIKAFWGNFKDSALKTQGAIKSVLFSFSYGPLDDIRSEVNKGVMPVYDEETFAGYLKALESINRVDTWDVNKLSKAVIEQKKTARSFDEHVKYLKAKHS